MQLEELKLVAAGNLINLRIAAGMTQAELGAKLNYSDKSISKWERGEAIPDAHVLTQMAELFGVTVDYILSSHTDWEPLKTPEDPKQDVVYSTSVIIAISVLGVWTLALTAFVALWLADVVRWQIFLIAALAEVIVFLSFHVQKRPRRHEKKAEESAGTHDEAKPGTP